MHTCYFTGHRRIMGDKEELFAALEAEIERHITERGVSVFYVGNYGEFDHMVHRALADAKKRHPEIIAQVALAYHPALRPVECPEGLDGTYFPEGQENVPPRHAIVKLNQYMVRSSDHLIAYVRAVTDGSYNLFHYAQRREKQTLLHITNLAALAPRREIRYNGNRTEKDTS